MVPGQEGQPESGHAHEHHEDAVESSPEPASSAPIEREDPPVVPSHVRAEELMPAATGGRRSRGGGGSMRFRFRRRKGGAPGNGESGAAE